MQFLCFTRCFCSFAVYLWLGFGKLLDNLAGFIYKMPHLVVYMEKTSLFNICFYQNLMMTDLSGVEGGYFDGQYRRYAAAKYV